MDKPEPFDQLTEVLRRLPALGIRSADRVAFRLLRDPDGLLADLIRALRNAEAELCACSRCGAITVRNSDPCRYCTSPERSDDVLCVVELPADVLRIEEAGGFSGRYHVLGGRLSPMDGEGVEDLRLKALRRRVVDAGAVEVVMALGTDVESEATVQLLAESLQPLGVRVTRIAYGLPAGSGIAYSDPETLGRALRGRQPL